jgi:phage-related protein
MADKPLVWLHGELRTPPFGGAARVEAGVLLRRLQRGERLAMPFLKAITTVGPRCFELRVTDEARDWRIVLRIDPDAIVIAEIFLKKTAQTPVRVIATCRRRLRYYDLTGPAQG